MTGKTLATLKSVLEISCKVNSNISNEDALLKDFLTSAVRLIRCKQALFARVTGKQEEFSVKSVFSDELKNCTGRVLSRESLAFASVVSGKKIVLDESSSGDEISVAWKNFPELKISSLLVVPVKSGETVFGVLEFFNSRKTGCFDDDDLVYAEILSESLCTALKNFYDLELVKNKNFCISSCNENNDFPKIHQFVAASPVMMALFEEIKLAAQSTSAVLLTGEKGSGKQILAEQLYLHSARNGKPFVRVNCSVREPLSFERELFGSVEGDSEKSVEGFFQKADKGVIFLDEVSDVPLEIQDKIIRLLEEKTVCKSGSSVPENVDVRIVASSSKNLELLVEQGKFREELLYRLSVYSLRVPSLVSRPEDIDVLSDYFLSKYSEEQNKLISGFSSSARNLLHSHFWQGNVSELEITIARSVIFCNGEVITAEDLGLLAEKNTQFGDFSENIASDLVELNSDKTLKSAVDNFKKAYVTKILEACHWNQTKAAKTLDIQRTYVSRLMNELHIRDK